MHAECIVSIKIKLGAILLVILHNRSQFSLQKIIGKSDIDTGYACTLFVVTL